MLIFVSSERRRMAVRVQCWLRFVRLLQASLFDAKSDRESDSLSLSLSFPARQREHSILRCCVTVVTWFTNGRIWFLTIGDVAWRKQFFHSENQSLGHRRGSSPSIFPFAKIARTSAQRFTKGSREVARNNNKHSQLSLHSGESSRSRINSLNFIKRFRAFHYLALQIRCEQRKG